MTKSGMCSEVRTIGIKLFESTSKGVTHGIKMLRKVSSGDSTLQSVQSYNKRLIAFEGAGSECYESQIAFLDSLVDPEHWCTKIRKHQTILARSNECCYY